MDNLTPINGYVLIELAEQYEYAATPEQQYATRTSGYIRKYPVQMTMFGKPTSRVTNAISSKQEYPLLDKKVWFKSYEDDVKLGEDNKYTFIKFDDIKGFEDGEA